ncbi:multidrug resistance protein [Xylariaceae sp. FL1272]|nr:multidrug resistance protein [Xylariaceae sp. FL1272]
MPPKNDVPDIPKETTHSAQPPPSPTQVEHQYSVFTTPEKWLIVLIASLASWTSNLSAFIYLPALSPLSHDLSVSVGQINLTLTVYMAVAAVAPILVGDAADVLGRRLVYFATLGIFLVACIAIALAGTYGELLGFRALQALGQSGIILIGYGVVSDVASPAERGFFMSIVSFAITVGPSVGPILGGVLCYSTTWRWIFWFLVINASLCFVAVVFLCPETSRHLVGNGSIPPSRLRRLPVKFSSYCRHWAQNSDSAMTKPARIPNPLRSLRLLLRKDNAVVVLAWGLMYTVYSCLIATLSTLFIDIYHLNEWQSGIIYLPIALGGTLSTFFSGWLLDEVYRRSRAKLGLSTDMARGDDLDTFPIEKARVRVIWIPMLIIAASTIAYGWVLQLRVHIAVGLILQFIAGFALQFNFSSFNTLLVDINHRAPSSANASTSIIRSAFSAITVAYIEDLFQSVGVGWTFTIIGGFCIISIALLCVEYSKGFTWRTKSLDTR